VTGSALVPFQGGFLCLQSPKRRTGLLGSGGSPAGTPDCTGSFDYDFNAFIASGVDPGLVAGQTVWAQFWSRDPAAEARTNLTDGVTFAIGP